MAVKSHSFLVRVMFILSLLFNVIFISRSLTGTSTVQDRANRFHHRAVAISEESEAGLEAIPMPSTRPPKHETPIYHASQEDVAALPPQSNAPPRFTNAGSDNSQLASPIANIRSEQHSQISEIKLVDEIWTVFEDLSRRDGDIVFESTKTKERRVFPKTGEASFVESDSRYPQFAGLRLEDIGLAAQDLLANQML